MTYRIVASQACMPLVQIPVERIMSQGYDQEGVLASIFKAAQQLSGCVIYLDGLESMAAARYKSEAFSRSAVVDPPMHLHLSKPSRAQSMLSDNQLHERRTCQLQAAPEQATGSSGAVCHAQCTTIITV